MPNSNAFARFSPVEDYAIIGNCRSAALVSRYGEIDWLCWSRFDSPSIFAALLDQERGGFWRVAPTDACSSERAYISNSNVLETRFKTKSGVVVLTDLMPVDPSRDSLVPDHEIVRGEIVRGVTCTAGEVELEVTLAPRARYGEAVPRLREAGRLGIRIDYGRGVYWLRSTIALRVGEGSASQLCRLTAGNSLLLSLSYSEDALAVLPPLEALGLFVARRIRGDPGIALSSPLTNPPQFDEAETQ